MEVKTDLATPLTLKVNQGILVAKGKDYAVAYNDPKMESRHYRDIPNDDSNEGLIKWANQPSIEKDDGTYMIAISMFEYIYTGTGVEQRVLFSGIEGLASEKKVFVFDDDKNVFPINGTVKIEGPRIVFRKLVWVNSVDLFLGTAAQQVALKEKQKKEQQDSLNSQLSGINSVLNPSGTSSNKIIIIVAVILVVFLLIFAIIKTKKGVPKTNAIPNPQNQTPVNIIKIPQTSKV